MTAALVVSEVSARSPDMGEREFAEFVEDIRANGQLVPIWVQGDEVIDGRKRLAACEQIGIAPKIVNVDPSQNVERIARALNVLRTHYSPSQRAIFAAERATDTRGGDRRSNSKFGDCSTVTVKQAADEAGISPSAVSKARQVAAAAAPEVVSAMKSGALTLHAASVIVESVPKAEQPAMVARVAEANKGKKRHTSVAQIIEGVSAKKHVAQPAKPLEQFKRSVYMAEQSCAVLRTNAEAAKSAPQCAEWLAIVSEARTHLTRVIKILEGKS